MSHKSPKVPKQLSLFSPSDCVVVDASIKHRAEEILPHVDQSTTVVRYYMFDADHAFKHDFKTIERLIKPYDVSLDTTQKRLRSFKLHPSCVCCGRRGSVFFVEHHANDLSSRHLNLYCVSAGEMVMMTVDHILPDSMGGKYSVENFQTMCLPCNQRKRHMMTQDEIDRVRQDIARYAKGWITPEYVEALLTLQEKILYATDEKVRSKLISVFDSYRKRVKSTHSKAYINKVCVDLINAIKHAERTQSSGDQSCQRSSNARLVETPVSTKDSWSVLTKLWSVCRAMVKGIIPEAASRSPIVLPPI